MQVTDQKTGAADVVGQHKSGWPRVLIRSRSGQKPGRTWEGGPDTTNKYADVIRNRGLSPLSEASVSSEPPSDCLGANLAPFLRTVLAGRKGQLDARALSNLR